MSLVHRIALDRAATRTPQQPTTAARSHPGGAGQKHRYLPLWIAIGFSALTIACYELGPYLYTTPNRDVMYMFLGAVHVAIIAGYVVGVRAPVRPSPRLRSRTLVNSMIVAWLGFTALEMVSNYYFGLTITKALADPQAVRDIWIHERSGTIFSYLGMFGIIPLMFLTANAFGGWTDVPLYQRLPGFAIIAFAGLAVTGGSRAGFYAVLTCVVSGVLMGLASRRIRTSRWPVLFGVTALVLGFAAYSGWIAKNRRLRPVENYSEFLLAQRETPIDRDHWYFTLPLPSFLEASVAEGINYFGHSYNGLGICLGEPQIVSGLGAGQAQFLRNAYDRISGTGWGTQHSYFPRLIAEGRMSESLWVTAYPWVASDVTWFGAILVFGAVANFAARAWMTVLVQHDMFAANLFVWTMAAFWHVYVAFPTGSLGEFAGFYGAMFFFVLTRGRPTPTIR